MAKLPDASSFGERPTPRPSGAVASYQIPRDTMAQSMQLAGQDIQQASAIIAETNRKQDTIAAEAALNKLQESRVNLEFDQTNGFRNVKEGGAVGQPFVDGYMGRFNDSAKAIADSLQNDQQRALFKQRMPMVGLQYRASLLQHQAHETDAFNASTEKSTLDLTLQDMAFQPTNDIALQTGLVRMNGTIDSMAQRRGLSPEQVTELKGKYQSAAYAARVQSFLDGVPGVVDSNPYTALSMIEKNRDKMLPETTLHLTKEANTAIRMLENAKRINDDQVLKEAEKSTEELQGFALSGFKPDEGYIAQVRAKAKGTPFENKVETLIAESTAGAMHGSQSIPRQQATIRQAEAAMAQNGANPEVEKILARAKTITNNQIGDYKENPWAASAKYQRLPSIPDRPLQSAEVVPGYIAQVLPLMGAIEAAAGPGIAVSPLQPGQAKAFSDQLAALPAGPRADVLGQTGAVLNAPRIHALADQIDKGNRPLALALKLGADQTNAGRSVSELVLRGSDAIKDKSVKRDDSTLTGWKSEISRLVRGTMGDEQAEQDVIDAAYYVRVAMDHEGTAAPGFNLTASNENAVKLVVGMPLERAGVKTILPRGMDENAFTEKVRGYSIDDLALSAPAHAVWVRGQPRTLAQLHSALPGMGMRRDSQGKYIPVSGGALVTIDAAGTTPLRLDVK